MAHATFSFLGRAITRGLTIILRPWKIGPVVFLPFILNIVIQPCFGQAPGITDDLNRKAGFFKNRNDYDSALYYYHLIDSSYTSLLSPPEQIQNRLNICEIKIQKGDTSHLNSWLSQTEKRLRSSIEEDSVLLANYFQIKGAYLQTIKQDSAGYFLESSIGIRTRNSEEGDTLLHYAWNKLGNYYFGKGNFKQAVHCHETALDLSKRKKDLNNMQTATSYQNLAMSLHMLGEYTKAETFFIKSLEINEYLFSKSNSYLAFIYNNLGKFYNDLSNYELALSYFDKAEQLILSDKNNDLKNLLVAIYWNKGNIFTHKGDLEKSITYLIRANSLFDATSTLQLNNKYAILMDLGLAYEMKGEYEQAIYYYAESAKNTQLSSVVRSYRNLGKLYSKLESNDSAKVFFRQAIAYTGIFYEKDSYDMALCYQYYAEVLSKTSSDSTLWYLNTSLDLMRNLFGDQNRDVARVRYLIGDFLLEQKKYDEALQKIQEAVSGLMAGHPESLAGPQDSTSVPMDIFLPDALNLKAKALYLKYASGKDLTDLQAGLRTIQFSLGVTEMIRTTYHDEESQIILNNNARETVDLGIRISAELFNRTGDRQYLSEAFHFSEKGKAIILLSALRGLEAKSTVNIPEQLLKKEDYLYQEIATCNNLIYSENQKKNPNQEKIRLLNDKLFSLRQESESLLEKFQKNYPEYYGLKYDYSISTSEDILKFLEDNQALLEYHLTDSTVYAFLLLDGDIYLKEICHSKDLLEKMALLRECFEKEDYFNSGLEEFQNLVNQSAELYDMLIRPYENMIEGKRLLIIPDAELGLLPFDLLLKVKPESSSLNYKGLPWLIRSHPISYSSSATISYEQSLSKSQARTSKSLIAFAPSYEYVFTIRDGSGEDTLSYNLPPILGTEEEVRSISEIYRTRSLFDSRASEENFKRMAPDYGILHLAMHTVIDNQKPLYSKLVFSRPLPGSTDDGYLNTFELFNLRLNGELAVLSACNTGTGKLERGEGIISLARGFFYSGIPSVIMTLWEIEDHSSADLMAIFYQNLKKGLPKDVALQLAKIEYLENTDQLHAHPYFWAGFVNIGKTAPIKASFLPVLWKFALYGACLALLITFGLFLFRRRVFFPKRRH